MQWYWAAIIAGIILPWLTFGKSILADFRDGGAVKGFGIWLGMCCVHVPIMLIIMWFIHKALGYCLEGQKASEPC
jgi:hypothetical protein